jgi:hypothetical protein
MFFSKSALLALVLTTSAFAADLRGAQDQRNLGESCVAGTTYSPTWVSDVPLLLLTRHIPGGPAHRFPLVGFVVLQGCQSGSYPVHAYDQGCSAAYPDCTGPDMQWSSAPTTKCCNPSAAPAPAPAPAPEPTPPPAPAPFHDPTPAPAPAPEPAPGSGCTDCYPGTSGPCKHNNDNSCKSYESGTTYYSGFTACFPDESGTGTGDSTCQCSDGRPGCA